MERLGQLMQADDQQLQDESQQGSLEIDEGEKEDPKLDPLEEREEEKQCETTNSKMLAQLKEVMPSKGKAPKVKSSKGKQWFTSELKKHRSLFQIQTV